MVDLSIEQQFHQQGFHYVCGIDEAGRGPLAGPVYAAAVILPDDCQIDGLDDSKKLTEKKREALFPIIKEKALAVGIGFASAQEVDDINVLNATFLAMKRATEQLSLTPDMALIDGNLKPKMEICPEEPVIKGDAKSLSIAAASVLAKVSRDHFMLEQAKLYPEYMFQKHKGYGTKLHYERIEAYGICPIHRKSFLKKLLGESNGQ